MVVHAAYLQVWADVGIFGFIAYGALTLGVLLGSWARPKIIPQMQFGDRVAFYNGIYVLSCWVLAGVFHPLSTEITEWVMFIVGLAGLQVPLWVPVRRPVARYVSLSEPASVRN
jgi:O-antigen ligase